MKQLLTILFSLVCFFGVSQTPYTTPYTQQGSPNTMMQVRGGWKSDTTAIMPRFTDTGAANLTRAKLYAGSIIFTTSDENYWYRSTDVSRWILVSSGSSTNCLGTRLISGSGTWSGVGFIFDVTDLDYYIGCNHYFASASTQTLSTADPSYDRFDIIYADTSNSVGIITGTPAAAPQIPSVDPLSRITITIIYVPAGSVVPSCTSLTSIYNENLAGEWSIASDATVDNTYSTNPCVGSVSTLVSGVSDGDFVSWQSGVALSLSDYPYTKFYVKLNGVLPSDPEAFLTVTYFLGATQVSSSFQIPNGAYGFDGSSTDCQLIVLPNYTLSYLPLSTFDKIVFTINGSPASFQLDRIYMLSCAYVPPTPANSWLERGNTGTDPDSGDGVGTADSVDHAWITNGQIRARMPADGINLIEYSDTTKNVMVIDTVTKKIYRAKFPTAYGTSPIVIVRDVAGNATYITCPTCVTTASWSLTGNAGTTAGTNFIGTTDSVNLMGKVNNAQAFLIDLGLQNTAFGSRALLNTTGIGSNNTAIGHDALYSNVSGQSNVAIGHHALRTSTATFAPNVAVGSSALLSNTTGYHNTAVGSNALSANTIGEYNTALNSAGNGITTGVRNTAIGWGAIQDFNPSYATIVGFRAGTNIGGQYNTAIGYAALGGVSGSQQTGNYNTAIGTNAGQTLTTGTANTFVGGAADVSSGAFDSTTNLGYLAVSNASKQVAFSQYANQFRVAGFTTSAGRVLTDVAGNGILTLEAPAGGSQTFYQTTVTGSTLGGNVNIDLDGNDYELSNGVVTGFKISGTDYWIGANGGNNTRMRFDDAAQTVVINASNGITLPTVTSGVIYGGTAVGSTLDLISTSGVGSTSAVRIKVGNNGGTTAVTFANSGAADFGSNAVTVGGNFNGFNGLFTGAVRSGAASTLSHNGRNIFAATSDGVETLTSSTTTANTALLAVATIRTNYVAKTANYTATNLDRTIECTTNAFTVTLPTAVGIAGQQFNIVNSTAANTITIATTSSQTFVNVTATPTTLSLIGLGTYIVESNGANWMQLK